MAISNEALEWLDRAEQAREVAGQLTDPGARKAVLQVADTFDRLARAAVARTAARDRESEAMISPLRRSFRQNVPLGRRSRMGQYRGLLTPEERARIAELQDLLIERFVEQREASAEGEEERVKRLEAEIDDLLREKEEVEKWATAGSA
jgi:hypothetical protein